MDVVVGQAQGDGVQPLPDQLQTPAAKGSKRKVPPFPPELVGITDANKDQFTTIMEIDEGRKSPNFGKEFLVVSTVRVTNKNGEEVVIDLNNLLLDHLRKLASNCGVEKYSSLSKFDCRKAMALFFQYQDKLQKQGGHPRTNAAKETSSICRAVNIVFSEMFVTQFLTLNDRKTRKDHEFGTNYKDFWIRASEAHNSCCILGVDGDDFVVDIANNDDLNLELDLAEDDDNNRNDDNNKEVIDVDTTMKDPFTDLIIEDEDDPYLMDLSSDKTIDLSSVVQYSPKTFQKRIMTLFTIRRTMKEFMTQSGTHDNEPWNFIQAAMGKVTKTGDSYTKIGVYYFYKRCESCPGIDDNFQPFLDGDLQGDSYSMQFGDNNHEKNEDSSSSKKRREQQQQQEKVVELFQTVIQQNNTLMTQLSANAEVNAKRLEALSSATEINTKKLKMSTIATRVEIAKSLGDTEELKRLMDEAKRIAE